MRDVQVRRVLDQIRGRSYEEAIMILEYMPYKVQWAAGIAGSRDGGLQGRLAAGAVGSGKAASLANMHLLAQRWWQGWPQALRNTHNCLASNLWLMLWQQHSCGVCNI
jgi:hypothetical protein